MNTPSRIADNLETVRQKIVAAAARSGRAASEIRLVAVSKTVDAGVVAAAHAAGQRLFGESRAQELAAKAPSLPADCEWHFIGPLQKNKVRHVVGSARWIHTLDSPALIERVGRIAGEEGVKPNILVQVNISGEASKHGCSPGDAPALVEAALRCPHLCCRGFTTIAPYLASEPELRSFFRALRELRDRVSHATGSALPDLSMGMSGDFEVAIEEGATLVRVGTAIFGCR